MSLAVSAWGATRTVASHLRSGRYHLLNWKRWRAPPAHPVYTHTDGMFGTSCQGAYLLLQPCCKILLVRLWLIANLQRLASPTSFPRACHPLTMLAMALASLMIGVSFHNIQHTATYGVFNLSLCIGGRDFTSLHSLFWTQAFLKPLLIIFRSTYVGRPAMATVRPPAHTNLSIAHLSL